MLYRNQITLRLFSAMFAVPLLLILLLAQPLLGGKNRAGTTGCGEPYVQFLPFVQTQTRLNATGLALPRLAQPLSSAPQSNPDGGIASWGSPIAVSPTTDAVWTVNPDAGTVSVIDPRQQQVVAEIPVGQEPWSLAIGPDGTHVYVADRAQGVLSKIAAATQRVITSTYVGPELGAIALTPSGTRAYVPSLTTNAVSVIDTDSLEILARIPVSNTPYAIGITNNGNGTDNDEKVIVTHFTAFARPNGVEATDDGRAGHVTIIDPCRMEVVDQIVILPDENGFPNLLTGLSIVGQRAWVSLTRVAPDLPNTVSKTVFAAVATLDLSTARADTAANLPLNDQDIFGSPTNNPAAVVPSPNGHRLYIVLAGSDLVEVVDIADAYGPKLVGFLPVSANPRGMAINREGTRGYVMNYLARSVTMLDLEQMEPVVEIPVTHETLADDVLRGKILFHNATDPRLSRGAWISCASCHPDGGTDNITWMFPDGPRQTPPLWNATQTLPWHWSAALDEAQDVEETIHLIQHGLGLAPGSDGELLAEPIAGRSADLDALAAFMAHGIRVPQMQAKWPENQRLLSPVGRTENSSSPHTDSLPSQRNAVGRQLFQRAGCVNCHGGSTWTSRSLPGAPGTLDPDGDGMVNSVLRQVNTLNPRDVRGRVGFAPPSLLNVALTAPYFHDGSMQTLAEVLKSGHPDPKGAGHGLTDEEMIDLIEFLKRIDLETQSFELPR